MKKNYFYALFASLMLFMAMPANAQVTMVDLYGKWKFTADIEWGATATEAQKAQISNECEVVIAADDVTGWYEAKIVGFAGSENPQFADLFQSPSSGTYAAKIANPNPTQGALFNGMLLANANGDNPYGIFEGGEWVVKGLGTFYYILNEDKTEMKVQNDFTIVTLASNDDKNPVVVATLRNAKMTFVEPATPVAVSDISGDYIFKAGTGQWSTMEGSAIPTEFSVNIVSKSEDNKAYDATIAIEGYDNVTLPATFDGSVLSLAFNNTYIKTDYAEVKNSIRFADYYASEEKEGAIEFKAIENVFSLSNGICLASDSLGKNMAGDADSTWVVTRQYYMDGSLKLAAEAPDFDWAGVYNARITSANDLDIVNAAGIEWPEEFQFKVEYVESDDSYLVTNVFGYNVADINYGGLEFVPAEDGKSVKISTGLLATIEPGVAYVKILNENLAEGEIGMTVNADGTMSIAALSIATGGYGSNENQLNAFYYNLVVTKEGFEPEVPAFNWAGQHTVKVGKVDSYDSKEYPAEFTMTVVDYGDYMLVTEFLGNDIAAMNYGGISFTVAADGKSAEMTTGSNVGGGYPEYLKIYDMNGQENPIVFTLNNDGSVTVDNFFVKTFDYNTNKSTPAAYFQDVIIPATGGTVEPEAPEAFDWLGTWEVTVGSQVSYDGKTYPESFYMTIEYNADWGMTLITQFMNKDVTALNQGGIMLNIAEDNKSAEMEVDVFAGGSYPDYLKIYDMNGSADSPIVLTANEDGTISFDDFFLATYNWDTTTLTSAVFCQQVTATKSTTGIENVTVENIAVKGIFDMQGRKIENITAPGLYIIDGVKVLVK